LTTHSHFLHNSGLFKCNWLVFLNDNEWSS
jgi:hypothetical protein